MFTSSNHAHQSNGHHESQNIHNSNGHHTNGLHPPPSQSHKSATSSQPKETVSVVGIPSVSIQNGRLIVGDSRSSQSYSAALLLQTYHLHPFTLQAPIALIHQSRSWETVHLEQSCCVIGMGRYRPIHLSLLCNVGAAQRQNGRGSVS
jgi:hypothetical protein